MPRVEGTVAPGFEPVRDAFAQTFDDGEVGAALCITRGHERVVDLWGGDADRATGRPFEADTPVVVFSATKGMVAACFLQLQDRGGIDLDAPIGDLWPEAREAGKGALTPRHLLNHRSGFPAVDVPLTLADLGDVARLEGALLAASPQWETGTAQGYHAVTYGMWAQAIFRRATGRTLGAWLRDELAGPRGAQVWLGLPDAVQPATLVPTTISQGAVALLSGWFHDRAEGRMAQAIVTRRGPTRAAVSNPKDLGAGRFHNLNRREVQRLELPWVNGFATARGLCALYDPLANDGVAQDGKQIVSARALHAVYPRQTWSERDLVLHKPLGWSQGFLKEETHLFSPNTESFGHAGMGGSLGWADPVARVSVGYVISAMVPQVRSPRALSICHALYACLGR